MKKLLVSLSLFCMIMVSNALALMPKEDYVVLRTVEKSNPGWGIVIAFIAIVLAILLIKIRISKKK